MRLRQFIIMLPFLWWGFDARAQVPDELSSMPEQWQLTLDGIKSKAQTLMVENNGLQVEYRELLGQVQKLQQSIDDQQNKNEQMDGFIKERHGQTDQQVRIEQLARSIKAKKQEARIADKELRDLQRKQSEIGRTIRVETLQPQAEDQLPGLRKQLEDDNKQEVLLENELGALRNGDKIQSLQDETKLSNTAMRQASGAHGDRYDKLKKRKEELEADINAYELRLYDLRQSSLVALSWTLKKKKLVHTMVQIDARNNQMRDKIKELREDIDVLRDQVARLERRVNFAKGKEANFVSTP